ncbi:hypothetical protein GQF03_02585 [Sneathiella chungangensis]|uniref:Helix-turn-helix domain-containing protein n=1 Tax=Sneathiella chungangensis TaxID=1418234 RepID=A0A845MCZ3_9PROT|nr:helix-turn-helix domain-containing protein [Sneathiella chungangensis]MZR21210.1 hypothetical protein [Sneathiella chungangensis]
MTTILEKETEETSGGFRPALSIPDTARAIGSSVPTVYREIAAGNLKAKKLRGRSIVLPAEIDRYLNALPNMSAAS